MDELFHISPKQISTLLALAKSPEMEQLGVASISFRRADLRGVFVEDAVWSEIDLEEADLSRASLQNASLPGANLGRAKLRAGDFSKANLSSSNLSEADLQETNLTGADLRNADLRGADLRNADLRGADLRNADLRGAYLRNSKLEDIRLEKALYDLDTKWPADFNILSSGAIQKITDFRTLVQEYKTLLPQVPQLVNMPKKVSKAALTDLPSRRIELSQSPSRRSLRESLLLFLRQSWPFYLFLIILIIVLIVIYNLPLIGR